MKKSILPNQYHIGLLVAITFQCGCMAGTLPAPHRIKSPSITAMPASPTNCHEPCGFPFYLPKPLLVISKNFHHIEDPKVGLTGPATIPDKFDDQSNFARLNSQSQMSHASGSGGGGEDAKKETPPATETPSGDPAAPFVHGPAAPVSPGATGLPNDGLAPHTFFTYEIVFVPDLTQKYVLQVEGGAGEVRAALNLVNGWQFTGLGPYYMKDSSTAQNLLAKGLAINMGLSGAADVMNSAANLVSKAAPSGLVSTKDVADLAREINAAGSRETFDFQTIPGGTVERYAEIYIYEASLGPDGQMQWQPVAGQVDEHTKEFLGHRFDRKYLGVVKPVDAKPAVAPGKDTAAENKGIETFERLSSILDRTDSRAPGDVPTRDNLSLLPPVEPQKYYDRILDRALAPAAPSNNEKHHLGRLLNWKNKQVSNQTVNVSQ